MIIDYSSLLTVLIFISAALTIRAYYPRRTRQIYFFKPLTMILIIALALFCGAQPFSFYGLVILTGFVFSTLGDFLLIPKDFFKQALASFLIAHVCYIIAFAHTPVSLLNALPFLLYAVLFLRVLWSSLGKLKIPVVIYALVIALMGWQAIDRWFWEDDASNSLAALGAVVFVVSDTILAYDRFKQPFKWARALVLGTYFVAQWLIALSV